MLFANVAAAQTLTESDRTARVSLMVRAEQARVEGNLDEAVQLATQAERIGATAGTRYFISRVSAQQSRYVISLENAQACLRFVDNDLATSSANRRVLRDACEGLRAAAMSHVAMLVVRVPRAAPESMVVRMNGEVVLPALYNVEQAVPVGNVSVTASMPGRTPQEQVQVVRSGSTYIMDVAVPVAPAEPVVRVVPVVPVTNGNLVSTTSSSVPGSTQQASTRLFSARSVIWVRIAVIGTVRWKHSIRCNGLGTLVAERFW
jgi:hypothetical protein